MKPNSTQKLTGEMAFSIAALCTCFFLALTTTTSTASANTTATPITNAATTTPTTTTTANITAPPPEFPTKYLFTIPRELSTGTKAVFCIQVHDVPEALDVFVSLEEKGRDEVLHPTRPTRPVFRPWLRRRAPPTTTTATTTTTTSPPVPLAEKALVLTRNDDGRSVCDELRIPRYSTTRGGGGDALVVRMRGFVSLPGVGYRLLFDEKRPIVMKKRSTRVTFVEMDKPVYKPGDLVRVRLLTIDADLKPLVDDVVKSIWIENPAGVRMEQWTNVSARVGFASVEMRLSEEPVEGAWKVKSKIKGKKVTKSFEVKKYVAPKYEVKIETPDFLLLNDDEIKGKVCARYTYGKRVKGRVNLIIQRKRYRRNEGPPFEINGPLGEDGCLSYNASIDLREQRSEWGIKFHFSAVVTERGTNVKMTGVAPLIGITRNPIKLEIVEMKSGYKPFIPGQILRVKATTASGAPAPNEIIRLEIRPDLLKKNVTTDDSGVAEIPLTSKLTSQSQLQIYAESLTYLGKLINSPDNSVMMHYGYVSRPRLFILAASQSTTMRSWHSPSDSFVKIEEAEGSVACGQRIKLPIHFTMRNKGESRPSATMTMQYRVVARGNIVDEGSFAAGSDVLKSPASDAKVATWTTSLPLAVDHAFAPAFELLVYYVRGDGEVVADEAKMKTADCLVNDVTIRFDAAKRLPGEKTEMTLKAAPASLCGFSVVDKSMALMGSGNTIEKEDVSEWFSKGEIGTKYFGEENRKYCEKKKEADSGARMSWRPWWGWSTTRHDSITAFRNAGILVITDMTLETRPCEKDEYPIRRFQLEGAQDMEMEMEMVGFRSVAAMGRSGGANFVTTTRRPLTTSTTTSRPMANRNNNNNNNRRKKPLRKIQEAQIRSFFPETWLWNLHTIDQTGEMVISKKVPHTITEWQARAVCSNADVGLGISPTESLVVFQPFFASAALPYSVIRHEEIPLKITVFNYLEECLAIRLKLIKYKSIMKVVGPKEKTFCLCAQNSQTESFVVVPGAIGHVNVTVSAEALSGSRGDGSGICAPDAVMSEEAKGVKDVVIKKLIVEPEGIEMESNYGRFVCLDPNGNPDQMRFEEQIRLNFDAPNYVKQSARLRVSAIGDVLGPALEGLDDLLRLPTGCGEQNMLKFAPNIFIMEYLEATNQDSKDIKSQAIGFMKTGYQRELTYRHDDGSYSAFGNSDDSGSLWLTAFVVKCFGQARKFIAIDRKDLDVSILWLKRKQEPSGKFPTIGRVLHKAMKGGLSKKGSDIGLTAYTLGALIEGGLSPSDEHIQRGLDYILPTNASVLESLDSYSLVLIANTLTLVDSEHPRLTGVVDLLESRKRGETGMRFWSDSVAVGAAVSSADIEMTAYALLTYTQLGKVDESVEMTRWLTQQRNAKGGFLSTQDTVMGLQALAKISTLLYAKTGEFRVKFETKDETKEFQLDRGNRLLLHRAHMQFDEFGEDPSKRILNVRVTPETAGCAMIQASLKYNVIEPPSKQKDIGKKSFQVRQSVAIVRDRENHCKWRRLETCVTYQGDKESGMVMAEVKMVSGWIPDKDSLKKITKGSKQLKRFDVDSRNIKFYLDDLKPDNRFCFGYLVEQQITVGNAKPGLVKVYDYYEPDIVVDQKYDIRQTCGTKQELPFNAPTPDAGSDEIFMQRRADSNPDPLGAILLSLNEKHD